MAVRILTADAQPIFRAGLRASLAVYSDFTVVSEASNAKELLIQAQRTAHDMVLMDIDLPVQKGLEALGALVRHNPRAGVAVLTANNDRELIRRCFALGACAYLLKDIATSDLVNALRGVRRGGLILSAGIDKSVLVREAIKESRTGGLTPRMRQILAHAVEGRTARETAKILGVSTRTVEAHRYRMMRRVGARNAAALAAWALKNKYKYSM